MTVTMTLEELATPDDIHAERPDIPLDTIRRHCRRGRIPGAKRVGRTWFIPVDAAAEYVENYARYARTDVGSDARPSDASDPLNPQEESNTDGNS